MCNVMHVGLGMKSDKLRGGAVVGWGMLCSAVHAQQGAMLCYAMMQNTQLQL